MILLHLSKYTVSNMLKSLCMHDKLLMINAVHFNRIVVVSFVSKFLYEMVEVESRLLGLLAENSNL